MTQRKILLGICGHLGSGKTTAARHLVEKHNFARTRFAGPLKSMLHCLGLDERHTDGELKEVPCDVLGGKTPRFAMQRLGTEWGRELIVDDLWIRAWKATLPDAELVVVDDVRFQNELDAVHELGGYVVRVDRPSVAPKGEAHASEQLDLKPVDFIIENTSTLEAMYANLEAALTWVKSQGPRATSTATCEKIPGETWGTCSECTAKTYADLGRCCHCGAFFK